MLTLFIVAEIHRRASHQWWLQSFNATSKSWHSRQSHCTSCHTRWPRKSLLLWYCII